MKTHKETWSLDTHPHIPLCDLLKLTGPRLSGGSAKHLIASGSVLVDGEIETRKKCKITRGQCVRIDIFEIYVI